MPFLSLHDAQILHSRGWGPPPAASQQFRVELAENGELAVYRNGFLGEKKVAWMSVDMLEMRLWTDTVASGGGFFGGGFGVQGAAEGMLAASVLNALTSRQREYAMLAVITNDWDGSVYELVFGWRYLSESDLRKKIGDTLPAWTASYVNSVLTRIPNLSTDEAIASYKELDIIEARGIVSREQLDEIRSALAPIAPAPQPAAAASSSADRIEQLKTLADLRATGALTEDEFEAEKARLLAP